MKQGARQRSCESKRRHPDKKAARDQVVQLARAGTAYWRLVIYRCRYCDSFHVGHRPRST